MITNISIIKKMAFAVITAGLLFTGCTKLDIKAESELTPDNFPTKPEHFEAAKGIIYTILPANYAIDYWRLESLSTDEALIPARAGNWDDGGQYRELHKHTWTPDNAIVKTIWSYAFSGVIACNRVLAMFDAVPEGDLKKKQFAEIRMMRAFFYFILLDNYGNVPILKKFGDDTPTSSRADVFAFIESEVKEIAPYLPRDKSTTTYGRPTAWMAHALLAKMYLNAQVYAGKTMYAECVTRCDSVIKSGLFALDADYKSMFLPTNGPAVKEFIFAVVYDAFKITGNSFTRYDLTPELRDKYLLGTKSPSNCMKTLPEFYDKFNLPGDVRNTTWLVGKQFNTNGTPITVKTSYKGLNETYVGPYATRDTIWQLELTKEVWLRGDPSKMDTGNDFLSQYMGARSIKFYPDPNWDPNTRSDNNDFPVFRYGDILMMKAEAILRGASATNGDTPVSLVNQIRSRAKAPTVANISLDEMLDERAREFAWEAWRRNDLIRFGKYSALWLFKDAVSAKTRELFPIPADQIKLNTNLVQNPGY
ncbi:MAG: RagB/SusD family nutrient uptake outer membrane protein [Mariniphaga sp.]